MPNIACNKQSRFLDTLVNAIPTVLVKNEQHRYIAANLHSPPSFGVTSLKILGKTDYDFFPPEDARFYQASDADALATGTVIEYERAYTLEGITQWMLVRKCRLICPDDSRVVVLMLSDVTQRRAAEQALRQSEARFRSLIELSADWYWEQDEEFRFTFVSDDATKRSGFPGSRSLGFTRWDHPGIDLDSTDWAAHGRHATRTKPSEFIYRRTGLDGSPRWVSVRESQFLMNRAVSKAIGESAAT
jgi:PAS domain S-box-containing protein